MIKQQPKVRLHNVIWKCPVCGKWFDQQETMYVVSTTISAQLNQSAQAVQVATGPVIIDGKCFTKLGLTNEAPRIYVPSAVPAAGDQLTLRNLKPSPITTKDIRL